MKRQILSLVAVSTLALGAFVATTSFRTVKTIDGNSMINAGQKVVVCHNNHEIEISINALPAHLAHGDLVGGCGVYGPPSVSDCNH